MMKYIVMQANVTDESAREDIIMFPDNLVHLDMAETMKHSYLRRYRMTSKVVSAGFVHIGSLECFGKSESLNIGSRPKTDSDLLIAGKYGLNIVDRKNEVKVLIRNGDKEEIDNMLNRR